MISVNSKKILELLCIVICVSSGSTGGIFYEVNRALSPDGEMVCYV